MTSAFSIGVFAVVRDDAGRVLLGHRRDCDFWGLPGGGMEAGEAPWQAAVREVQEETGLTVEVERLSGVYSNLTRGDLVLSFACAVVGGALAASIETDRFGYFPVDALPPNIFAEHIERIHDALADHDALLLAEPHVPSAAVEKRERLSH